MITSLERRSFLMGSVNEARYTFWQTILDLAKASGMPKAEWCRKNCISIKTFNHYEGIFRRKEARKAFYNKEECSDPRAGTPAFGEEITEDKVVARLNEENDGVLKGGMAVAVGTSAGHSVAAIKATSAVFEGVIVHHQNVEQNTDGEVVIKKGSTVGVMTEGKVWGRTKTGATPTYKASAYVETSGDDAGTFTETASATTIDVGAKFGNESDDGIAVIEL